MHKGFLAVLCAIGCVSSVDVARVDLDAPWLDPDVPVVRVGPRVLTRGELYRRVLTRLTPPEVVWEMVKEEMFRLEARARHIEVAADEAQAHAREQYAAWIDAIGGEERIDPAAREAIARSFEEAAAAQILIERVVAAHRRVDPEALVRYHGETYAHDRIRVSYLSFPMVDGRDAALAAARRARDRIAGGDPWEAIARDCVARGGQDVPPEALAGQWGVIDARHDLPPAVKDALFALDAGGVSDPVWQEEFGYHVFTVTEKIPARSFEECRGFLADEIRSLPVQLDETQSILGGLRAKYPTTFLRTAY